MKLRKALDQAKFERDKDITTKDIPPPNGHFAPGEWICPGYDSPNTNLLDPIVVEKNRGVCLNPNPGEIERYKILRIRIEQAAKERKMNTIMVTSPNKGNGKTVTCINMGLTFAQALNQTALIVDCDLKGQDIHRYLGIKTKQSLIDYFLDDVPIKDLIIWPGVDKLNLISGDRTVDNATELLSSKMMINLIREMGNRYNDRYVFLDAPPILEQSEAISMAPFVDGILMVIESGRTTKTDLAQALSLLPRKNFLGFVLNKQAE